MSGDHFLEGNKLKRLQITQSRKAHWLSASGLRRRQPFQASAALLQKYKRAKAMTGPIRGHSHPPSPPRLLWHYSTMALRRYKRKHHEKAVGVGGSAYSGPPVSCFI